jgi:uncharacterized protein (UPF0371 family)
MSQGFDTARYYEAQMAAFTERIIPDHPTIIEFGGKPFGDFHASRVLPGYDPDVKAAIVRDVHTELGNNVITMAVHARDILAAPNGRRPGKRIRGDYGITYEEEALRMADEARQRHGIPIAALAITATPPVLSSENADFMSAYTERLEAGFDTIRILPELPGYPNISERDIVDSLTRTDPITAGDQSIMVVSPGGGSGKFSVAITEMAHKLASNHVPNFLKFETFPVFRLSAIHPLNRAFIAATADLGNEIVELENGLTNYDKDIGNFTLLKTLLSQFPDAVTPMAFHREPTDMGVNVIEAGITDEDIVANACKLEIKRRIKRYETEVANSKEHPHTIAIATSMLL